MLTWCKKPHAMSALRLNQSTAHVDGRFWDQASTSRSCVPAPWTTTQLWTARSCRLGPSARGRSVLRYSSAEVGP